MFGIKKREKIFSVASGMLIPIDQVPDEVFSEKMMGDGYAIIPSSGKIFSPVDGIVSTVFPTQHAIGIKTKNGLEILIHMGLDTVELNGRPFSSKITQDQKVKAGDLLSEVDIDQIEKEGKNPIVIVVFTNSDIISKTPEIKKTNISNGEDIGFVEYK